MTERTPELSSDASYAWYGKIPGAGDFVTRRMAYGVQHFWDDWLARGMAQLRLLRPEHGWDLWRDFPMWAFLLPAQAGIMGPQCGVLAPSCDRVGRNFPVLISWSVPDVEDAGAYARCGALAMGWCAAIAQAHQGRQPIDAFDAALGNTLTQVLAAEPPQEDDDVTLPFGASPVTLPWPDLARTFDPRGQESYWWSLPPAATGYRAMTHTGALNAALFSKLYV